MTAQFLKLKNSGKRKKISRIFFVENIRKSQKKIDVRKIKKKRIQIEKIIRKNGRILDKKKNNGHRIIWKFI